MRLICFGVRDIEIGFFHSLNTYNYELCLVSDNLSLENVHLCNGYDAIMVRGHCDLSELVLLELSKTNVMYILTRTVGLDHINIGVATQLGYKIAYVPAYSPNAVAELTVSLALNLLRNIPYTLQRTSNADFTVTSTMFSREIRNCTVGVIGTGRIGTTTSRLFRGLGANIIGYDVRPKQQFRKYGKYVTLEELLLSSDIVSLHIPYVKEQNHHLINSEVIGSMKENSILINTSRGPIVDNCAIIEGINKGILHGFGGDVLENERLIFDNKMSLPDVKEKSGTLYELLKLYPKVIITPHIGSFTDEALLDMISYSYENLYEFINTGTSINEVFSMEEILWEKTI